MEYFFSLPKIEDLTIEQQAVLYEDKAIALSGGAGTGKSVVSIFRHLNNFNMDKSSIIITYTKTLQKYLWQSIKTINFEASKRVHSAKGCLVAKNRQYCDNVDEIIVDEAQDLEYRNIEILKSFAKNVSYGADFNQKLYKTDITKDNIRNLFPKNENYHLEENFRNTKEIIDFTKVLIPNFKINADIEKKGKKPRLFIGHNQINKILEIIEDYKSSKFNIAILLPFTANVDYFFENLKDKVDCSYYHNKMNENDFYIKNIHITTFKSSKGLEFDTVIIPDFHDYNYYINNMDMVTENDYYVAFTRAKINLFLISSKDIDIDKNSYEIEEF